MVEDFTGGIYVDGGTDLEASALQAGYWMPGRWLQIVGGLSRLDSNGYIDTWNESRLGINLDVDRLQGKVQISHNWISNRFGLPAEDYEKTRLQLQYVW